MKRLVGRVLAMVSVAVSLSSVQVYAGQQQGVRARLQHYYFKEDAKFLGITMEGNHQALVSYRYHGEGMPVDYDWWNLRTWKKYVLPTSPAFVKLLHVGSPTEVKFLATGRNAIDGFIAFPYIIDCVRGNSSSQFETQTFRDYVGVGTPETFGDGKLAAIIDIRSTIDGIQVGFGPVRGDNGSFMAGATGIPLTTTSYDSKANEFIIHFAKAKVYWRGKSRPNRFIASSTATQVGAGSEIVLHLTKDARYYTADQRWVLDSSQEPYLSLHFIYHSPNESQVKYQPFD